MVTDVLNNPGGLALAKIDARTQSGSEAHEDHKVGH